MESAHKHKKQPELAVLWRHPNFQHGAQTQVHDLGSLFNSLLRLEMSFFHSTLGAVPLNDKKAYESEKTASNKVLRSLEVKRLKTGVFRLKDLSTCNSM